MFLYRHHTLLKNQLNNKRFEQNVATYEMDFDPDEYDSRLLYNKENWANHTNKEPTIEQVFFGKKHLTNKLITTKIRPNSADKIVSYCAMDGKVPNRIKEDVLDLQPLKFNERLRVLAINDPRHAAKESFMRNCNEEYIKTFKSALNALLFSKILEKKKIRQNDFAVAVVLNKLFMTLDDIATMLNFFLYQTFGVDKFIKQAFKFENTAVFSFGENSKVFDEVKSLNGKEIDLLNLKSSFLLPPKSIKINALGEISVSKTSLIEQKLERERQFDLKWDRNLRFNWDLLRNLSGLLSVKLWKMEFHDKIRIGMNDAPLYDTVFYGKVICPFYDLGGALVEVVRHTAFTGYLLGLLPLIRKLRRLPVVRLGFTKDRTFFLGERIIFRVWDDKYLGYIARDAIPATKKDFIRLCRANNFEMVDPTRPQLPVFRFGEVFLGGKGVKKELERDQTPEESTAESGYEGKTKTGDESSGVKAPPGFESAGKPESKPSEEICPEMDDIRVHAGKFVHRKEGLTDYSFSQSSEKESEEQLEIESDNITPDIVANASKFYGDLERRMGGDKNGGDLTGRLLGKEFNKTKMGKFKKMVEKFRA